MFIYNIFRVQDFWLTIKAEHFSLFLDGKVILEHLHFLVQILLAMFEAIALTADGTPRIRLFRLLLPDEIEAHIFVAEFS